MLLTVVICTHERDELLSITLESLARQSVAPTLYRVLVVDNAPGGGATQQVATTYAADYVHEPKLGHSHARNRGCQEATTPWVLYLDDDVKAPAEMIGWFLARLSDAQYAALGGAVRPWFLVPPPTWSGKYFAHTKYPSDQREFGPLPEEHYLVGCLFAVRKAAWVAIGGFSDGVGMHGHVVGRGDDGEFQWRLRQAGFVVYYDPAIYIDHLIQPYKYTLSGHLRLAFASGRDTVGLRKSCRALNLRGLLRRFARISGYNVPYNLVQWWKQPDYHWQNVVVDSLTKYYFAWGQYVAHRQKHNLP